MPIRVERLDPSRHERAAFESGNDVLDRWLRVFAHQNDARLNTGRTFVAVESPIGGLAISPRPILGYVTIAAHAVGLAEARVVALAGSMPDPVPAVLIARLAVDRRRQGQQLGGRLLQFAVERILAVNREVAVTLVVADAIDDAAVGFYRHHGFIKVPGTTRLVARTGDLSTAF